MLSEDLRRARRLVRRLQPHDPASPIPPPLPPGCTLVVPDRGELFVRHQPEPPGALPVLLLHGWTVTADLNWFAVYSALEGRHPVVALDHRGHGRGLRPEQPFTLEDCADDAAALLRALGYRRAVVVGYSMGGPIALLLAHRHRELAAGLVLSATAMEWRATLWERFVWRWLALLELALRAGTDRAVTQRLLRDAIEDNPELVGFRPWLFGETRRGDTEQIVQAGRALSRFDARSFAGSLGVPAALVRTTRDRLVRPRKQTQLAGVLRARMFSIAADHDAPLLRTVEFSDLIVQAIAAVLPEERRARP